MVEIVVTCDRCGKKFAFEAQLTSNASISHDGFSYSHLDKPREVSVLENIRTSDVLKGHWTYHDEFGERLDVCPDCTSDLTKSLSEQRERIRELENELSDIRSSGERRINRWMADNCNLRRHVVTFYDDGKYVVTEKVDDNGGQ